MKERVEKISPPAESEGLQFADHSTPYFTDEEVFTLITTDVHFRVAYFEHDFEAFFDYHFGWANKARFEEDWNRALEGKKNLVFEAFRGSRKTTRVRAFAVWTIAYRKDPYIIVQSYESSLSGEWVRNVAKMLTTPSIVADYGELYPFEVKKKDLGKSGATSFESTNGIKIESKSLGEVLRGANDYNKDTGAMRPTLLIIDDIDTTDSVKNPRIIEDNWQKLTGETIEALDQFRRRIIVLGNTIAEDGILPRFKALAKDKSNWHVFRQPLIEADGTNAWPSVFTEEVIENLRITPISFQQNYELIPYKNGQTIIPRSSFKFATAVPQGARIIFSIDPAFSTKTNTDPMALAVIGHIGVQKYVKHVFEFKGAEKNEETFCTFVEGLYKQLGCSLIRIENNNGGAIIARMLQKRNLAVMVINSTVDKIQRTREREGDFARGEVYFLPGTESAQDQIASFPNADHDDMVDAVIQGLDAGIEVFTGSF